MSRYYNVSVEIEGFNPNRESEITIAAKEEWDFEDWYNSGNNIDASGDGYLCGGESEEEFAERLSKAIWKANGAYCRVAINCTYLEDLPSEYYELSEDQFDPGCLKE